MDPQKVFSVSEFNEFINTFLSQVGELVIEGEITELKISQGKWIFLTIKDQEASLDLFGTVFQIYNHQQLQPGMLVKVYGTPSLYQKTGRFSFTVHQIVPSGEGALQIAYEKLKQQLEKEGLFDPARKRLLPQFPERIGLITAKGSQAYQDFTKILMARMGGIKIYFHPVQVQGKDSVNSIIRAINHLNESNLNLDVIVIARGGGSLEDLISFNDEKIARTVFASHIPTISAVGHEGNVSLCDLVADLRASTPSNAAELVVPNRLELIRQVDNRVHLINSLLTKIFKEYEYSAQATTFKLSSLMKYQITNYSTRIEEYFRLIDKDLKTMVASHIQKLQSLTRLLQTLDYRNILKRGFSITYDEHGKIIKELSQAVVGRQITTSVADGKINSTVLKTFVQNEQTRLEFN